MTLVSLYYPCIRWICNVD